MFSHTRQCSRVRPVWSQMRPYFSIVRQKKMLGCTGETSHSSKKKVDNNNTLCPYCDLNQSEIVKGGTSMMPMPKVTCSDIEIF